MEHFYTINRVKSFVRTLDNSSTSIVPIYINNGAIGNIDLNKNKIVSCNAFVKNLKAYAKVSSLQEIALPTFSIEDSESEKLIKTLNIEWGSPRKQLDLHITENGRTWADVGSISILNPFGYPYRLYNLQDIYTENLAIELGINGGIGISFKDVGYGKLESDDKLTIHGSVTEEIIVGENPDYNVFKNCQKYNWEVTQESALLLPRQKNRKYFIITNLSNESVFLSFSSFAEINKGIPLTGNGSNYEASLTTGILTDAIYAISFGTAQLTAQVCF